MNGVERFDALATRLRAGPSFLRDVLPILTSPGDSQEPFRRLLAAPIAVTVANPEAWPHDFSQFVVTVSPGPPTRITVTLPEIFRSVDAALERQRQTGRPSMFDIPRWRDVIAVVLDMIVLHEVDLLRLVRAHAGSIPPRLSFVVSMEDCCAATGVLTLSRFKGSQQLLLPNPPFFHSDGYSDLKLRVLRQRLPWRDRSEPIRWRGSTTGSLFTAGDILANERIRLAARCAERPDLFDAKITAIAQVSDADLPVVRQQLETRGLMAPWEPAAGFHGSKHLLHIDGNASAFGLFEALCLGGCIFKVESRFEQWFESRLVPWEHYVPVAADLSDLLAVAAFLRARPDLARRIARQAFSFALDTTYYGEAGRFVDRLAGLLATQPVPVAVSSSAPALPRTLPVRVASRLLRLGRRIVGPRIASKIRIRTRVSSSLSTWAALTAFVWRRPT